MDYTLIGNAAMLGAIASLGLTSLGLGATGRLSGGFALFVAVAAIAFSFWVMNDWTHVTASQITGMLPHLGIIAGGALAGAVVGAILPLILNAINEAMRGDVI